MVQHAHNQSLPVLNSSRAGNGVPTQVPGSPKILFRIGDFSLPVEITHVKTVGNLIAVKGIHRGKFVEEECVVLAGPKAQIFREHENSGLTIADFWCVYNGRRNFFHRSKNPMIQEEIPCQTPKSYVFDSKGTTIIAITKNRAESIGLSLSELRSLWGKPHSAPIIEGDYLCLHQKEAR